MSSTSDDRNKPKGKGAVRASYRPCRSASAALTKAPGAISVAQGEVSHALNDFEAQVWQLCDGRRSSPEIAEEIARDSGQPDASKEEASSAVRRFQRLGLLETIEEAVLKDLIAFHGAGLRDIRIADLFTGDYFTAVELSDGSQGAAINFNNVSGPHRASYSYQHYDFLLKELAQRDGLLLDAFLLAPALDCLGRSVKFAILNALSRDLVAPSRARADSLSVSDGYLDLASFLREGDTVAMIGCTGNYSCPEVGRLPFLKKIFFSDFEYVEPFKSGIQDCIRQFFAHPEKVVLSDGKTNEAICGEADVVVIIADTICTGTLDQLLAWSAGAREVLITGRSYAMDPVHAFHRGASGLTTQRIVQPHFVGFVRDKVRRGEFGFTDSLVGCFERMFWVET
jgi:uncharacterized protein (DUF4213/DUF364 family)